MGSDREIRDLIDTIATATTATTVYSVLAVIEDRPGLELPFAVSILLNFGPTCDPRATRIRHHQVMLQPAGYHLVALQGWAVTPFLVQSDREPTCSFTRQDAIAVDCTDRILRMDAHRGGGAQKETCRGTTHDLCLLGKYQVINIVASPNTQKGSQERFARRCCSSSHSSCTLLGAAAALRQVCAAPQGGVHPLKTQGPT